MGELELQPPQVPSFQITTDIHTVFYIHLLSRKVSKPVCCRPERQTVCTVKVEPNLPESTELNFSPNYELLVEYGLAAPDAILRVDSNSKTQIVINNPHAIFAVVGHNVEIGTGVPCPVTNLPKKK